MTEQGTPGEGPQNSLAVELASLRTFKGRVDELLRTLGESDGSPHQVADTALTEANLGKDFNAAKALFGIYNTVHTDLSTLAQLLSDQIEALSSTVLDAHGGYANTDAEEREKLWAIHERMQRQYDPKLDPHAEPAQPHTSRTGPRTDLHVNSGDAGNGGSSGDGGNSGTGAGSGNHSRF
ncbi:hypothetical protein AB0C81_22045 [Streptomyces roseoverticillatus]|uniref:hypothetical protein n=1 Tax=Streptomyces roseoverticillatus TaxID=66429 RepID=UPI0033E84C4D